jgi:hypothetical protein
VKVRPASVLVRTSIASAPAPPALTQISHSVPDASHCTTEDPLKPTASGEHGLRRSPQVRPPSRVISRNGLPSSPDRLGRRPLMTPSAASAKAMLTAGPSLPPTRSRRVCQVRPPSSLRDNETRGPRLRSAQALVEVAVIWKTFLTAVGVHVRPPSTVRQSRPSRALA